MKVKMRLSKSKVDLEFIMTTYPNLSDIGFEHNINFNEIGFRLRKKTLLGDEGILMFNICWFWLGLCTKSSGHINYRIGTSYSLKHAVEGWIGRYISNGAFIAAVISLSIPYKAYDHSPNIHVALSSQCPFLKRCRQLRKH